MNEVSANTTTIWDLVEGPPALKRPARAVSWSVQNAEFTTIERVRNTLPAADELPPGIDKYLLAERWADALRGERGGGFEYTWRDDQDRRVDPTWITLRSALVDEPTGRIVACGHLTHENWGLSAAYDLGAITGSNGMSWATQGHADGLHYPVHGLYIGNAATGMLAPLDASTDVVSVDLDACTGTIAVLESLGPVGCLALRDAAAGAGRRRLAVLEPWSGNEQVRFSLDKRWLLVSGSTRAWLCEVDSARILRLPVSNCAWWPLADSTLLEVGHENGRCVPRLFSLESNQYVHEFPEIALNEPMLPGLEHAWCPAVSPDGKELLVLTPAGVQPDYRAEHGVGLHLARISLQDGRGGLVYQPLLDEHFPWERDVEEVRWVQTGQSRVVQLHGDLERQMQPPVVHHEALATGRYSPEAEAMLIKTLNLAISLTQDGQPIAYLMPEILSSLVVLREDPARWTARGDSLLGVVEGTSRLRASGAPLDETSSAWQHFANALNRLSSAEAGSVNPLDAIWI